MYSRIYLKETLLQYTLKNINIKIYAINTMHHPKPAPQHGTTKLKTNKQHLSGLILYFNKHKMQTLAKCTKFSIQLSCNKLKSVIKNDDN